MEHQNLLKEVTKFNWRNSFLIIAHRGASAYEPENTMSAFRKALDMGANALEFDVRRSRDGVPVVIHDEDLKRIAGIDAKVRELDLVTLKSITIKGKEHIPTLEDVLSELGNRIPMFIEIKDEGIEKTIINDITKFKIEDNVILISFNYKILSKIRELNTKIDLGLLTYKYPLPILEAIKLKALALLPRYNLLTLSIVKEIHSKNLKIYTWTINDVSLALRVVNYNVDGIATDDPKIKESIEKQHKLIKYF